MIIRRSMKQLSHRPPCSYLYKEVQRASWIGLLVNIVLGVVKLVGGILSASLALIADAMNSIGDAITSVIVLCSLKIAQQPPDEEHPYGHTRAEGIAALTVSILIIVSALYLAWEVIKNFGSDSFVPPLWALLIAGANVLIKEGLYRYKYSIGRRTGSAVMIANAWDHRADALCGLAVLIGLAIVRLGGPDWSWADKVASLVVIAAIVWAGMQLYRNSASELMDLQAEPKFVEAIRHSAVSVDDVVAVEKLWVRKSGLEFFIDIHIEVPPTMTVHRGHEVGHAVKAKLLHLFPSVRDVLVHLEPVAEKENSRH
jgi:cation diffusion facilitator family transporter